MKAITVTPAFGKDYKSAADAKAAWTKGTDFFLETIDGSPAGTYCSSRDFGPGVEVRIRYHQKERVTFTSS